ncbi:MAG: hypothetical protein AAFX40_16155 [Cyanobacteria bacterium J06639_1]
MRKRVGTLHHGIACSVSSRGFADRPERYRPPNSRKAVNPRDLPSDVEIEAIIDAIADPYWQKIAEIYAAFGIRTGEIVYLGVSELPTLLVTGGKTGKRRVTGVHQEWIVR